MVTKKTKSSPKTKTAKKPINKKAAPKPSSAARKTVYATEPYHPVFGIVLLIISVIIGAVLLIGAVKTIVRAAYGDAEYFSEEYTGVPVDNVFKIKTLKESLDVLESGTGVIFLGFPECPWCQAYAPMLNDLAKEYGISEIYYTNIKDERENDTENYKLMVDVLSDYLQEDEEGNKRIYVPETVFVIDGAIIGSDHETSKETLGYENPEEYWTEKRVETWKQNVGALMSRMTVAE